MKLVDLIRISKPITWALGPEFFSSLDLIEIDITYACNLKCLNCNRSCSQAPDDSFMSVNQLEKFLTESITNNRRWRRIRLLGGEPFLHPKIFDFLDILVNYKKQYSCHTNLEVSTNGYGSLVNDKIKLVPSEVKVNNTYKESTQQQFEPFNQAPCDLWHHKFTDYQNGCWVTNECGIGLNMYGFYHCAVAAGIDRVIGLDIGLKSIPSTAEQMIEQKRQLCRFCGHFLSRQHLSSHLREKLGEEVISKTWMEAYSKYKEKQPNLTKY